MATPDRSIAFLKDPSLRCTSCGVDAVMGARFCRRCGRSLETPGGRDADAQRAEHKQVTVLVADVQGSMTLSERLDPEEWYRIVTRFFVLMADGVQRVGGVVNRFTGDGIMALFGAPVALEDHAQRACYAALRLRQTLDRYASELRDARGIDLAVRIGIHSGGVVAGPLGRQGRGGYTALGSTVHLASEMERIAAPGRIFVSETTARLVDGYFHLTDRGTPGRARGVLGRVYEVVGVGTFATRLERSRSHGLLRFVGRGRELRALERALEDARAGRGAIVGVRGEVGVGKSRLCDEFLAQCRRDDVAVHRWQIRAHLQGMPFLTLVSELRRVFGIAADTPEARIRERIHEVLSALSPGAVGAAPFFEQVLGIGSEPPVIDPGEPGRLRVLLSSFFAVLGEQHPAVVLIEDVQWIDPATHKLLLAALEVVAGSRVLLLLNFRPEFRMPSVPGYVELALQPLGPRAANELLGSLLGDSAALADLAREIRERSNGNPLFMEELVRMLAESGSLVGVRGAYRPGPNRSRTTLPSSLQALLESRIDLLPPREKVVLHTASVVGQTFGADLLRRVLGMAQEDLDEALVVLQEGEFIRPSVPDREERYGFRHPMMHEQAYASQVTEDLAAAHAEVARACVEVYAQQLDERSALIAHHWEHAGRFREAALWAQRAAISVGQRNLAEGLRAWRRVFALLERAPASRETDELAIVARCRLLELGSRVGMPPQEVAEVFEQASALAARLGDPGLRALVHDACSQARAFVGDVAEALELAREAVRAAAQTGDADCLLGYRAALLRALLDAGGFQEARALADVLVAELDARGARPAHRRAAQIRLSRGLLRTVTGQPRAARVDLAAAADAAWEAGDVETLSLAYAAEPLVATMLGDDPAEAVQQAQRSVELAEHVGNPYGRVVAYGALGLAYILAGDARRAVRALNGALLLARDHRVGLQHEASLLADLACATALRGQRAHALSLADEAVHVARGAVNPLREVIAQLGRAWVLLQTHGVGAVGEIEASLGRVLATAASHGLTSHAAVARHHLASVARLLGDEPRRRWELERASAAFGAMGATGWQQRIAHRLAEGAAS